MVATSRKRPSPIRVESPVSATDLAYEAVKREIVENRLKPGEPVPVERFTRELKLSRTPVREAILRLGREGLITIRPRLGTFVSHLDLRHIRELYAVRRLLEGEAARLAALRMAIEPAEQLHSRLIVLERAGTDPKKLFETGQALHPLVAEHCGNRVLADMIAATQDHFKRFRSLSLQIPEKLLSSHREHLAVLEALIARDAAAAERLMQAHFEHAAEHLLSNLLHGPENAPLLTVSAAG